MKNAPVALFCFNRPGHLSQVLDALLLNPETRETEVFAFCDGPRGEADLAGVEETRKLLRSRSRELNLSLVEREANLGLRQSILQGVSRVLADYGRVIVVEDDVVASPFFLAYMNHALQLYADQPKVMHISGYFLPVDCQGLPEAFFYRPTSCWGWGTWADRWRHLELDARTLLERVGDRAGEFNLEGAYDFLHHLRLNLEGKLSTWAIFWYASVFLQGGLCLHPSISLTRNIGHDGRGTNCRPTGSFQGVLRMARVREFPQDLEENVLALERARQFYLGNKGRV